MAVRILNGIVSWKDDGIQYEPDQRHVEIVIKALGLEEGKSVVTPGVKEKTNPDSDKALEGAAAMLYRSMTMRLQ